MNTISPVTAVQKYHRVGDSIANTMLLLFFLALSFISLATYADGLFDFQMKLAKDGNTEAQFKVGEMYETGFGVKQDRVEAEKWIKKAADKGHETAGFKLLYWDVEKNGLKGGNKEKVDALVKKAEGGNAQAQYYVGKMRANGVGLKKDADKAIGWLNKAAFVGVLEAERELTVVREDKQRQILAKRRADEKKRAQLKAKQEKEKRARLEQERKLMAKSEAEAKAKAKAKADSAAKQKQAKAAALEKAKKEQAEKERLMAKREAEARKREAEKKALLKKRAEQEKTRKAQFESDPCSGKSARFLSTCK